MRRMYSKKQLENTASETAKVILQDEEIVAVKGNVELEESPTELASIQIGEDKFKVGHSDAEIKALAKDEVEGATGGTIASVLGLDADGGLVKGTVSGGGKVYMHKLDFAYPGGNYAHCVLYSASNTPFTLQTLNKFLNDNNINNMSSGIPFWIDVENSFSIMTDSSSTPYITTIYRRLFGDVGTPALCYKSSKKDITIDTTNNKIIFGAPSSSTQYLSVSSLTDTIIEI